MSCIETKDYLMIIFGLILLSITMYFYYKILKQVLNYEKVKK